MVSHNIRFKGVIWKIIPFYLSYLEQWVKGLIKVQLFCDPSLVENILAYAGSILIWLV